MSGVLARIGSTFIAEAEAAPGAATAARALAPAVAVLAHPADAHAAGAASALRLAQRVGTSHALLCAWTAAPVPSFRAPASRSARRAAQTLAARGHAAAATGRLVVVTLGVTGEPEGDRERDADAGGAAPGPAVSIAAEVARAAAAAGDFPCVTALGAPREDELDSLLRVQDRVLVAAGPETDPVIARLALESVSPIAASEGTLELPAAPAARALATAGVALVPPLRAHVDAALEGLR